jgi:hypothetical protein
MLQVFLTRGVNELTALRDAQFTQTISGNGTLIRSAVNGSSFEFAVGSALTSSEIVQFAQIALNHKAAGITSPVRRTTARFY